MDSGLWPTFIAAVQAAVSVLFTVFWGVVAGYFEIIDDHTAQKLSHLCVTMLLPALLVTNIGAELNPDNVAQYSIIIAWSMFYTVSTLILSFWLKRIFKFPPWVVVATTFNSNTSMPLLLTQTLAATGIIDGLLASETDTVPAAVNRAKSYFLANALCGNVLTFALGPKILQSHRLRHAHADDSEDLSEEDVVEPWPGGGPGEVLSPLPERATLLQGPIAVGNNDTARHKIQAIGQRTFQQLPTSLQATCTFMVSNPVFLGGVVAAVLGLVPVLHRAFFNSSQNGGVFHAWFVTSIETVGDIFVGLQILIVGERLSKSLREMARGGNSGRVPWSGAVPTLIIRYIVWPLVSIALISHVYIHTPLLSGDPMLPFAMMLMPCGPPAMKLTALADVSGSSSDEKLGLAKFLTISYALSPALAFAVAGSFKATEAGRG